MYPLSMEDWIRMHIKPSSNSFIIWKALVLAFPSIRNWLCWKVENGRNIRLGPNPWVVYDV
jgi:hypothetical protein